METKKVLDAATRASWNNLREISDCSHRRRCWDCDFFLSLATISAATTDVIFSCVEDQGEYADTDLETDSAGNIYGTTVLGGDFGGGTVFQLRPTPDGWV